MTAYYSLRILQALFGYVRYPKYKPNLFIIGLHWEKEKPKCSNLFLSDRVDELKRLSYNGMITEFGTKFIVLNLICFDLSDQNFVTRTKNFNAYNSCSRCIIVGERINFKTCFLRTILCKRTPIVTF